MTKINSYKNNYMARRAHLFGILSSNPNWTRGRLTDSGNCTCNIGFVMRHLGYTDTQMAHLGNVASACIVAKAFGLRLKTVQRVMYLNDDSINFETNVRALRTYLLNKNWSRTEKIVNRYIPNV